MKNCKSGLGILKKGFLQVQIIIAENENLQNQKGNYY